MMDKDSFQRFLFEQVVLKLFIFEWFLHKIVNILFVRFHFVFV